eukprot:CAMPEP_0172485074 /NCGR_PEP_ID=MMETSP1066-20121228/12861_1 /TAXON_ID=671091 /ORGANISM="Coscinodiscus wailesii, Strain CCMP2513" /LENGTH=500 /DNA_ID=CAMNT_0013250031 /DNA_START=55 /DNA_END=1554 /DNA_ORIENTATION=+
MAAPMRPPNIHQQLNLPSTTSHPPSYINLPHDPTLSDHSPKFITSPAPASFHTNNTRIDFCRLDDVNSRRYIETRIAKMNSIIDQKLTETFDLIFSADVPKTTTKHKAKKRKKRDVSTFYKKTPSNTTNASSDDAYVPSITDLIADDVVDVAKSTILPKNDNSVFLHNFTDPTIKIDVKKDDVNVRSTTESSANDAANPMTITISTTDDNNVSLHNSTDPPNNTNASSDDVYVPSVTDLNADDVADVTKSTILPKNDNSIFLHNLTDPTIKIDTKNDDANVRSTTDSSADDAANPMTSTIQKSKSLTSISLDMSPPLTLPNTPSSPTGVADLTIPNDQQKPIKFQLNSSATPFTPSLSNKDAQPTTDICNATNPHCFFWSEISQRSSEIFLFLSANKPIPPPLPFNTRVEIINGVFKISHYLLSTSTTSLSSPVEMHNIPPPTNSTTNITMTNTPTPSPPTKVSTPNIVESPPTMNALHRCQKIQIRSLRSINQSLRTEV